MIFLSCPPFFYDNYEDSIHMVNFEQMVAGRQWTALLVSLPTDRNTTLRFTDCRSMESFRSTVARVNARGDLDVRFSVSLDYRQKIVTIKPRKEDGQR